MKTELQPVILAAGKGSRMTELTNKIPKCLLPIANKPMIHFPLTMLIEADFKDVIIIIPDIYENEIKSQLSSAGYKINMEFISVPYKQDLGTADSLKQIHKRLISDVLILSCDFISNYPLRNFINFYRINDPSLTVLIANESSVPNKGAVPGRKTKFKTDKDIIGIDSQNPDRIVFFNSEVDFEEFVNFKLSMVKLCPNINLFTSYLDGHCYILKKYLINYLVNEKNKISSIKGEFIPNLIKSQFKRLLDTDQYNPYNEKHHEKLTKDNQTDDEIKRSVYSYLYVDDLKKELDRFDPLIDRDSIEKCIPLNYPDSLLNCSSVIVDKAKYLISRSNNILSYYEINKLANILVPDHQNADFGRAQITHCLIGNHNKINERTSIKHTIIGNNCTINEKVRLENCLIMDNVVIDELCVIKNSIICNNAKISKKSTLTDCVIASDEQIAESTTLTSESIVHTDQMMEI